MANYEWEVRAKERRLENKQLKKRIKELTFSRDEWKVKAMKRKENLDELNQKLFIVKKNMQHYFYCKTILRVEISHLEQIPCCLMIRVDEMHVK